MPCSDRFEFILADDVMNVAETLRRSFLFVACECLFYIVASTRASARLAASSIACDAPFEPMGYTGCAALPNSVTLPCDQRWQRVAITHGIFEGVISTSNQSWHVEPVSLPVCEVISEDRLVDPLRPILPRWRGTRY